MNKKREAIVVLKKVMGNALCDIMGCRDCKAMAKLGDQKDGACPAEEFNSLSTEERRNLTTEFIMCLKERAINEHPTLDITMDDLADIFVQEMLE